MSIVAARIDNRLLHGIVAMQWTPQYQPQRVMVIDDEFASDPTKKASMRMARPAGVALSIISRETAYDNFAAGKYDDHTVFVITKNPEVLVHLLQGGQQIPVVVLGGTAEPEEGQAATQVSRRAYVTDAERSAYRAMIDAGCDVVVQYVPADKPERLNACMDL